ncbi:hypothetical protein [Acinetobacter sp. KS-LM10]|uniref:hypothetical protein n=1 Tax=Acinetobacter sp. KS-LM10 TaxID=3120518 RepID=UPI0030CE615E
MNAKDKNIIAVSMLKERVIKTAIDGVDAFEKIGLDAKNQSIEVLNEQKEIISADVVELSENIKTQLKDFKSDVLERVSIIKDKIDLSQQDIAELKTFVRKELNVIWGELTALVQEIKADAGQISDKHIDHVVGTLKRSKEHTLEVWEKISEK